MDIPTMLRFWLLETLRRWALRALIVAALLGLAGWLCSCSYADIAFAHASDAQPIATLDASQTPNDAGAAIADAAAPSSSQDAADVDAATNPPGDAVADAAPGNALDAEAMQNDSAIAPADAGPADSGSAHACPVFGMKWCNGACRFGCQP
jgi:hypothetical protein